MDKLTKEIVRIVRDAITDGLIKGETRARFEHQIRTLKGKELEDYIQRLWDEL